jgi:tRNA G18 (ribose-2'-O)-methylase SpoU
MSGLIGDYEKMIGLRDRDLRGEGFFVAEGRLLVERTIAGGFAVEAVFADAAAEGEARALAARYAGPGSSIPVFVCDAGELDRVAGFPFHRGMMALARRPDFMRRADASAVFASSLADQSPRILLLPSITDPGNLGTLLRSALAFSYDAVWIGKESCDPFNRKALRASMGAALALDLREAEPDDLADITRQATENGRIFPVLAAALEEGAVDAEALRGIDAHALVLGNEFSGIPEVWRKVCTQVVRIPVSPEVDSLNVAIAGSILMYELGRRSPR